jgi:hypothetical protein
MYEKNKYLTKCPAKIGHLCLRFGHFRLSETNFAEIRCEFTVKRRKYRVCGLRSRLGRSERENPVRNVETPGAERSSASSADASRSLPSLSNPGFTYDPARNLSLRRRGVKIRREAA